MEYKLIRTVSHGGTFGTQANKFTIICHSILLPSSTLLTYLFISISLFSVCFNFLCNLIRRLCPCCVNNIHFYDVIVIQLTRVSVSDVDIPILVPHSHFFRIKIKTLTPAQQAFSKLHQALTA